MGKIYLCEGRLAEHPFCIMQTGMHIWSIEELCYFIIHYLNLVDENFFSNDLMEFLRTELGMEELVMRLKRSNPHTDLPQMLLAVISQSGYLSQKEIEQFKNNLNLKSKAQPSELMKSRGDFMASKGQYMKAVKIYEAILQEGESLKRQDEFLGRVYYNQAVVLEQLFLFEKAMKRMTKACLILDNEKVLKDWYFMHLMNPSLSVDADVMDKIAPQQKEAWEILWKEKEKKALQAARIRSGRISRQELYTSWKKEYREMLS